MSRRNLLEEFKHKVKDKQIRIAVVGLGYVGLPLAVEFAKAGFFVLGIDVDEERINRIKTGISYITDIAAFELRQVLKSKCLGVSADFSLLKNSDVIFICVPTPLKRKYSPDISFIMDAVKAIPKNVKKGVLIVLESTTYPGTTEEIILPLLRNKGLIYGSDFFLAFSPERIDPGNAKFPLHKIPKVVGGLDKTAAELAAGIYKAVLKRVKIVSSARVAEAVKLLENTFRVVNIALIDEMAMMAHKMKMDIWEIIEAAKSKPFGFMPFYPGPGVGGHCIPKDPLYLYWRAKQYGFKSRFIKLASEVISQMPLYVVARVGELVGKTKKGLDQAKVLVVGVTYKKDVKDLRKSPAIDMIECLMSEGAIVSYYDPLVPYLKFNHINLKSIDIRSRAGLKAFDCVLIATDHTKVDYKLILRNSRLIFDTRNIYKSIKDSKVVTL